jgi:hypothetical protein
MLKPGTRIEEMFAFTCIDTNDVEGIISVHTPALGNMPLVGADMERIESLRPHAELAARASGQPVKLVKFSHREVLETFAGSPPQAV